MSRIGTRWVRVQVAGMLLCMMSMDRATIDDNLRCNLLLASERGIQSRQEYRWY
jgi:hypothetical protein